METAYIQRKEQLKKIAEIYFNSLRQKSFSAIPFSDDVVLRAPITPGGVLNPGGGNKRYSNSGGNL